MININQRRIILLFLLAFSLFMILSSANAETIQLGTNNFTKDRIESGEDTDIFNLDPSQEYSLNSPNIEISKNITIQSANQLENAVINLKSNGRAFTVLSGGHLTLKNITIVNGHIAGGGGVINNSGNVTLMGCNFTDNIADFDNHNYYGGGVIFNCEEANLTANDCIFSESFTIGGMLGGGGVIRNNGVISLTDCIFTDNTADRGGVIYNTANVTLTRCTFINSFADDGAAIYNTQTATLNANNCNFNDSMTSTNSGSGGAIYNKGDVTLTACNFTNNIAFNRGGAICSDEGNITLTDCNFIANIATNNSAGAIYNNGGATLTGCTFTENKVNCSNSQIQARAGAIWNNGGTLTLDNCNFTNNTSSFWGGAIFSNAICNLSNCFFINNSATQMGGALFTSGMASVLTTNNCTFSGNKGGPGNFSGGDLYNSQGTSYLYDCNFTETPHMNTVSGTTIIPSYNLLISTILTIETSISYDKITITANLTNEKTGEAIANKTIIFYVDGKQVGTGVTNAQGIATYVYTTSKSGTHKIDAEIKENTNIINESLKHVYLTSSDTGNVNVQLDTISQQTSLTVATVVSANKITITAKAINKNTGGAIVGQTVYFIVNGKQVGTKITNSAGVATFIYNTSKSGTYKVDAKINGFTTIVASRSHIYPVATATKNEVVTSAKLKLFKATTSKATKKKTKKVYTKTYKYKNTGHITGSKTFTIKIAKKYKLSGKITKSSNVSYKYNSKTKKITVNVKKLDYNKVAQVKFKIIQA